MSQITTKVLKQGITYPNVISCSFFTMKDSYRNFEKYQRHLQNFLRQVLTELKNYEIRIYTDDTGKDFALKVSSHENISVIHFDCSDFRDGIGHVGTFGTLVRFLPLFEEHSLVWISDIDIPDNYLSLENSDSDFRIYTLLCYDRKVYGRNYTMTAGRFISRHQLPRALLTRFLNKVIDGEYQKQRDDLNAANKRKPSSKFPYGMDELFLNWSVYDWIKRRNFQLSVLIDCAPTTLISYNAGITKDEDAIIYNFYKTGDINLMPKLINIYRRKVPLIINKYPCLQPFLDKLKINAFKNDFYIREKIESSQL